MLPEIKISGPQSNKIDLNQFPFSRQHLLNMYSIRHKRNEASQILSAVRSSIITALQSVRDVEMKGHA